MFGDDLKYGVYLLLAIAATVVLAVGILIGWAIG